MSNVVLPALLSPIRIKDMSLKPRDFDLRFLEGKHLNLMATGFFFISAFSFCKGENNLTYQKSNRFNFGALFVLEEALLELERQN